jgi:hypothetical protein
MKEKYDFIPNHIDTVQRYNSYNSVKFSKDYKSGYAPIEI